MLTDIVCATLSTSPLEAREAEGTDRPRADKGRWAVRPQDSSFEHARSAKQPTTPNLESLNRKDDATQQEDSVGAKRYPKPRPKPGDWRASEHRGCTTDCGPSATMPADGTGAPWQAPTVELTGRPPNIGLNIAAATGQAMASSQSQGPPEARPTKPTEDGCAWVAMMALLKRNQTLRSSYGAVVQSARIMNPAHLAGLMACKSPIHCSALGGAQPMPCVKYTPAVAKVAPTSGTETGA